MDPHFQQRLRDEVIYLHSLWHQGPPPSSSSSSNTNPRPNNPNRPGPRRNPTSQPDPPPHSDPQFNRQAPSNSSRKRIRNPRNERERPTKKQQHSQQQPDPPPHSNPPWPCPSPDHNTPPGQFSPWPENPNSAPPARPPPPEEQSRLAALALQQKALASCRGLLSGNAGSDSEESDDDCVENEYTELLDVFVERRELRSYYEGHFGDGEFCCLVCGGLGRKKWVKGCVGLVQHSISVSKKRRAHRSFAQVVCRVLGWDFNRLPVVVIKGERLSLSLGPPGIGVSEVNAGSCEGVSVAVEENVAAENAVENNVAAENAMEDIVAAENAVKDNVAAENDATAELGASEAFDDHQKRGKEVMICQNSFEDDGTKKSTENIGKGISETEANKEAVDTSGIDQSLVSRTKWPCAESSISSSTVLGWPAFSPHSASPACSIPVEEQARSAALLLQQKALKECQDFFAGKDGPYSDEVSSEDEDEGNLMDEDGSQESRELKFFSKIFTEDEDLRNFYVNNYEGGEFCCLVCGGVGKKLWKRFKGCVALLQHSNAIMKTKKKVAHRAYGQVIRKVCWDIDQPPTTGSKDKPLHDGPLVNSTELQGELEEKADDHKGKVVSKENLDSMSGHDGEIVSKEESDVVQCNGTSKTSESQGELEGNADDCKDNAVVSKENLESMSGHNSDMVSKEVLDVQSNGTSKTCELQGELEEKFDDHKETVVSNEILDSIMSVHNGEIVSEEESDGDKSNGRSKTCEFMGEVEENADDHKGNVFVSKESLKSTSDHNGEILSKEESDVQSNRASKTCELQDETKENADGHGLNEDLNVFMENLDPL